MCVCVWGGGTLIFSYIRRLGPFLGVQNFEFKNLFGFSAKMNIFLVLKFCGYFWGVTKISLYLGAFLCILGSLRPKCRMRNIFWVA